VYIIESGKTIEISTFQYYELLEDFESLLDNTWILKITHLVRGFLEL